MRGRMAVVNSFMSWTSVNYLEDSGRRECTLTTKQSPRGPQQTTLWNDRSSSILLDISHGAQRQMGRTHLYSFLTKSDVEGIASSGVAFIADSCELILLIIFTRLYHPNHDLFLPRPLPLWLSPTLRPCPSGPDSHSHHAPAT